MGEIIKYGQRMSPVEYDQTRDELRKVHGDNSVESNAKRDQALATLFVRSGWTQEDLAKKEGKNQPWISKRLRFGRFLNFIPTGINSESIPKNLTEGRFREFWQQTEKTRNANERERFTEVLRLIRNAPVASSKRKQIGTPIRETFADGKWHGPSEIAQRLHLPQDHVVATLEGMLYKGSHGVKAEKKRVGQHDEYRLFPMDKQISSAELVEKLGPIIEELYQQGSVHQIKASPPTILHLAHQLKKLLDAWAK